MRISSFVLIVFLLLAGLLSPSTPGLASFAENADGPGAKSDDYRKEVENLKKRIEQLEMRLKMLEESKVPERRNHPLLPNPPQRTIPDINLPQPQNSARPKIWGRGECNGWEYYIIPLSEKTAESRP